ncbi:hypothetical protein GCM10023144_17940 [Pigmentiphaga soli]|uniref:Glutaredoxin domain-containing protein n=1 Tax=Pigmentiphaga soli TaxID=1007095 RepID=A0ABP8GUZ7_9BURK
MQVYSLATDKSGRPEVSVYWQPGCSSCLKTKEFVEEQGIPFESINVLEDREAMKEIMAAGLRSIPVVRKGDQYIYAQSVDDVAELLGASRDRERLAPQQLLERWEAVLERARVIVASFDDDLLERRAVSTRPRTVKDLSAHVFQIVEAFMLSIADEKTDFRAVAGDSRAELAGREELLRYADAMIAQYRAWRRGDGVRSISERMQTYYGDQPSQGVLERGVWHSAQHARQLDHVAAGVGAELQIPVELYQGLPMPKRLWA